MFLKNILNFIFPCTCCICGKKIIENETYTCENCSNIIKCIMKEGICVDFKNAYFDKLVSAVHYDGIIRKKILEFKFKNKAYLGDFFSKCMVNCLKKYNIISDIIIPVPLHYKRYFERGYNQSAILAKKISKQLNIKYDRTILKKVRNTKAQSTLKYDEREINILNSYKIFNNSKIKDKSIMLIDDVFTTGATANECSKVLKENGASKIIVVTISFVRRNFDG